MTKEEHRVYHNENCLKTEFITLEEYEWLGCPYPQGENRSIKIGDITMETASLYKCKRCGLEILATRNFRKFKNISLRESFVWEGSETWKKFDKVFE